MQLPKKISEQLQFTTIRLEVGNSRGTGFIFDYNGDNNFFLPKIKISLNKLISLLALFYFWFNFPIPQPIRTSPIPAGIVINLLLVSNIIVGIKTPDRITPIIIAK
jgi:hypothetical protein